MSAKYELYNQDIDLSKDENMRDLIGVELFLGNNAITIPDILIGKTKIDFTDMIYDKVKVIVFGYKHNCTICIAIEKYVTISLSIEENRDIYTKFVYQDVTAFNTMWAAIIYELEEYF